MAMRRIVIAEHGQVAQYGDALGIGRHQQHRLRGMAAGREIGLAHYDGDLAARIAQARRPPLAAVDNVFVAVPLDPGFDVGGVGRCGEGLGHEEGGTDLAIHDRGEPFVLLFARAVAVEHLHVPGIGRGAVEHFRRKADAAHFLGAQRIFEIGQARPFEFEAFLDMMVAVIAGRHEEVPDAFLLGLGFQFLDHGNDLPAIAFGVLLLVGRYGGTDVIFDEVLHPVAPVCLPFCRLEIHRLILFSLKSVAP